MGYNDESTLPEYRSRVRKSLSHITTHPKKAYENMTVNTASTVNNKETFVTDKWSRKSRSKSIGPGGLDDFMKTTGNKQRLTIKAPILLPKPILKLTMPTQHKDQGYTREKSPKTLSSPFMQKIENLTEPESEFSQACRRPDYMVQNSSSSGISRVVETSISLKTEEEQQAALRNRLDKEILESKNEVLSRRDIRRKSLANRRVSFAPEATLHTWDVVEYQEFTASTNSTSSRKRDNSTPCDFIESSDEQYANYFTPDLNSTESWFNQVRDETPPTTKGQIHSPESSSQFKVNVSPAYEVSANNQLSSSPISEVSADENMAYINDGQGTLSDSNSDEDGTMMSLESGESPNISMAMDKSDESTQSDDLTYQKIHKTITRNDESHKSNNKIFSDDDKLARSYTPLANKDVDAQIIPRKAFEKFGKTHPSQKTRNFPTEYEDKIRPNSEIPLIEGITSINKADDDGTTMDVTPALGGILRKRQADDDGNTMEVTRALGGILSKRQADDDENTMEVTRALGGILSKRQANDDGNTMEVTRALGGILSKRQADDDENTMEVTRALGGILSKSPSGPVSRNIFGNYQHPVLHMGVICGEKEEVVDEIKGVENIESSNTLGKMKFTCEEMKENMSNNQATSMKCFSPLSPQKKRNRKTLTNESSEKAEKASYFLDNKQTTESDVLTKVIEISSLEPSSTTNKDTTRTHGGITSNNQRIIDSEASHKNIYQNTNRDMYISPINLQSSPPSRPTSITRMSATGLGSPSLLGLQRKELRRSYDGKSSIDLASRKTVGGIKETIITENSTTQLEGGLQIEENVASKSSYSCKGTLERCSNLELKVTKPVLVTGEYPTLSTQNFQINEQQLSTVPKLLLTPQRRKTTGIGLDKVGLGSPLVADLLDRRSSIGGLARKFVLGGNDHIILSPGTKYSSSVERSPRESTIQEIKVQRSRVAMQEKTCTNNLKEMIQSLTPNKRLTRGRKSLHVGGAKGILGKRPIELDDNDDDDDEMEEFKRYKAMSPFKSVSIQSHPETKMDFGKFAISSQAHSNNATSTIPETSISLAESSKPNEKLSELSSNNVHQTSSGILESEELGGNLSNSLKKEEYNPIQLQDFLEMTRIRFMELTTTKRRHTIAPKSTSIKPEKEERDSLEECIVAGATKIPMLELFQHACHELKRYISDGRKTVREIEKETWEENPPLFQEYLSATPDLKLLMDNQLKNVRTHARLLAKGLWYDWRMTLLNTLEGGLAKTIQDMTIDENTLDRQQLLLAPIVPNLTQTVRNLENEEAEINAASREIANCDQDKLGEARHRLVTIDTENKTKKLLISELQNELRAKEKEIELGMARKKAWKEEINEHEKIKEEYRGWTCSEVNAIKNRVCKMEEKYGWTITRISGTLISMIFQKELELTFDASSFRFRTRHTTQESFNPRIGLKYIGSNQEINNSSLTTVKDFFLQFICSEVSRLQHRLTNIKDLLGIVSNSWNKANEVINEVYLLTLSCPTNVVKISNNSIAVNSTLFLKPLATKIAVNLHLTAQSIDRGIEMEVMPDANVIYGERFNEPKMKEFLLKRCRYSVEEKDPCSMSAWCIVVGELGDKLLARGRR